MMSDDISHIDGGFEKETWIQLFAKHSLLRLSYDAFESSWVAYAITPAAYFENRGVNEREVFKR